MKALIIALSFFVASLAFADRPELEEGKIYRLAPQYMCTSEEVAEQVVKTQFEKGVPEARALIQMLSRIGRCSLFPGGGAKLDSVLNEWEHDGELFYLIRWLDAADQEMYGLIGFKAHGTGI